VGLATLKAAQFIMHWEKLEIRSVKIFNKPLYSSNQVNQMLKHFKGNILSVNLNKVRDQLLTINEIQDVSLSRKLPSVIEARFVLRKPMFQLNTNNSYQMIDSNGIIIGQVNEKNHDLVELRNMQNNYIHGIVPLFPKIMEIKDYIEYVSFRKPYGIMIKLKGINEIFFPGEDDFAFKINYYLKLRKVPLVSKYNIKYVDLRFKDRFYFEYEEVMGE
jgi:cell division septal protein FtsQ